MNLSEAAAAANPLQAILDSGLDTLSKNQTLSFQLYSRYVYPQDGYVFWVATGNTITATGSLHYATDRTQDEDQTIGINTVIFSSEEEITPFNEINPGYTWIAQWQPPSGSPILIAFSKRGRFYDRAKIWHYVGFAVYPAFTELIVDSEDNLPAGPIVSNSLPIWLTLTSYGSTVIPVYPSFLLPDNIVPPYVVAHIGEGDTEPVAQFPTAQWPESPTTGFNSMASLQLMRDKVKLIFYGLNNQEFWQYYWSILEASRNLEAFGFASSPAVQDTKRTQVELASIAVKKTMTFLANYYQGTSDTLSRNLIVSADFTPILE